MTSPLLPPPRAHVVQIRSAEHVGRYIRELIFDGLLVPGQRLRQDEIARTLGVSRIPLREALIALEREGWVTLELHRGAFVNRLDEQTVRDHYELFGLLYAFSVKKSVARSTPELVARLSAIETELHSEPNPLRAGEIALSFHAAIIDAARSHRIKVLFRAMSTVIPGNFFEHVPKAIDLERKSVPAILRAIRSGDGAEAATAYEQLVQQIGDEVVRVLRARGLFV